MIEPPRLPLELELDESPEPVWSPKALRELARQLGRGNDFYFPLLGAARLIEMQKK